MVTPTPDGLPRCHEAGKLILPKDMELLASGLILPLQHTIHYLEGVHLKDKDPNYPVFSVKVSQDPNFVHEDPADIFFIAFEDVFNLFHWKRLDYNLVRLYAINLQMKINRGRPPQPPHREMTYYVVFEGRVPGVYEEWEDCKKQVHKLSGTAIKDLINWVELDPAIKPSIQGDQHGCWSGSSTILLDGTPAIMYTGIIQEVEGNQYEVQNLAYPTNTSDPLLREWVKPEYNHVIIPDASINATSSRTPPPPGTRTGTGGCALSGTSQGVAYVYRSRDFRRWTRMRNPLHSAPIGMWECPDFYPVNVDGRQSGVDTSVVSSLQVKHVLKNSLDLRRYDYYTIGTYDRSFYDPAKHRGVLWGWANESDTPANDIAKQWAEIQADVVVTFEVLRLALAGAEWLEPALALDAQKLCSLWGADVAGGVGPFGLSSLTLNLYRPTFAGFVDRHNRGHDFTENPGRERSRHATYLWTDATRSCCLLVTSGPVVDMGVTSLPLPVYHAASMPTAAPPPQLLPMWCGGQIGTSYPNDEAPTAQRWEGEDMAARFQEVAVDVDVVEKELGEVEEEEEASEQGRG
ncbi:hypothetical protein QYE76_035650 [Lolium multiflorum]|uniref:Uncharacterized protein n=1 Tax=Lolium multiflorum TaxID=4521 RepID=A0AAD8R0G9_LOLMU|nr:hypothetical protein QYE76_035650 [Lolium multiflorum]